MTSIRAARRRLRYASWHLLQRQSAEIDTVSGATYTSDGFRRSLQAALDAAGF